LGYNDVLRDEIADRLTAEQREMLRCVGQSAGELLALINATLDLSRLEAGQVPLDVTDVDVRDLLRDIEADAREFLRSKAQLRFGSELAAGLPPLRTDAGKLKVILRNLIHNAVKFTDAGGIALSIAPRAGGVELCVCDTGLGIPPEALPVIFDAFRQVDGSMTRRHGGVGLGLHVVKRLVELLNGSVSVQSRLGEGSTFRIWLPAGVEANGTVDDPSRA
jgi:signal transduction histidine kinase